MAEVAGRCTVNGDLFIHTFLYYWKSISHSLFTHQIYEKSIPTRFVFLLFLGVLLDQEAQ